MLAFAEMTQPPDDELKKCFGDCSTDEIVSMLTSGAYSRFVSDVDDGVDQPFFECGKTDVLKVCSSFDELLTGFGINDQGSQHDSFQSLVCIVHHFNTMKKYPNFFILPFLVMTPEYERNYLGPKGKCPETTTLHFTLPLARALEVMKKYNQVAESSDDITFCWLMLSDQARSQHCPICVWTAEESSGIFMDSVGDEGSSIVQEFLPYSEEFAQTHGLPVFHKAVKLSKGRRGQGCSGNIQKFLEEVGFSTRVCVQYSYVFLCRLIKYGLYGERDESEILAPTYVAVDHLLYAHLHSDIFALLASRVKLCSTRLYKALSVVDGNGGKLEVVQVRLDKIPSVLKARSVIEFNLAGKSGPRVKFENERKLSPLGGLDYYILGPQGSTRAQKNLMALNTLRDSTDEFTQALGLLEEFPDTKELSEDKDDIMYTSPISDWACSSTHQIDLDLFIAAKALDVPYTIKTYLHKSRKYRVVLKSLCTPWCCVDVDSEHIPQSTIIDFWENLRKPESMTAPNLEMPTSMDIQKLGEMSCFWRSLAALMGGDEVLCRVWLQKITEFLAWRGFPEQCTSMQLTNKDPLVFGDATNQLVRPETIMFVLKQCKFKLCPPRGSFQHTLTNGCGRFMLTGFSAKDTSHLVVQEAVQFLANEQAGVANKKRKSSASVMATRKVIAKISDELHHKPQDVFEVDAIMFNPSADKFEIKWHNFSAADNSMEPESSLVGSVLQSVILEAKSNPGAWVRESAVGKKRPRTSSASEEDALNKQGKSTV